MQEQCGMFEAVRVGTMEVNLSSPGKLYAAKKSNQKEPFFNSLSHVHFSALHDKLDANYHVDSLHTEAASGSACAGIVVSGQSPAIGQVLPAAELASQAANEELMRASKL
jgi:hypothetical protein